MNFMICSPQRTRRNTEGNRILLHPSSFILHPFLCVPLWFIPLLCLSGSRGGAQPAPPTAVEAVAFGQREIRVYWNLPPEAVKYVVERDGREIGAADAAAREFTDAAVEPGRTYRYSVGAADAAGKIAWGRPYVERTFPALPAETRCDVLVVGATTAGVAAAVTSARYGLNVVLIEETRRLGGMPVNGLGATDLRRLAHASGFFEEFRRKVQALYGGQGDGLKYEPRVAHQAMKEILWSAPGLVVHRQVRPVRVVAKNGVVQSVQVEEVATERRAVIYPRIVIDATDCGDVAAWAGAPFRVGREPRTRREPHAGYIFYDRATDRPLSGSTGKGDRRVQAYAYLMTVQNYGPGADKTIPKPEGYDPTKYEHAPKWENSWAVSSGALPNNKFEINQHPQGSDLQVVNYTYPTASYTERRRIEKLFKDHALGYLYYIQTVEGCRNIGLSEDDYRDSGDWPTLLYIREARRFESDIVLDETDICRARESVRPDAIGIGDYPMDSHAVEPKTDWTTPDMGEGEFYLPQYTPWHQVPYRVMLPKRLENVFVPTAVSATHVAYGTVRLEPIRMHFGEAAGVAAYLCLRCGLKPREVPARQIQAELLKHEPGTAERPAREGIGAPGPNAHPTYLYMFSDVTPDTPKFEAIEWLGERGFYPCPPPPERGPSAGLMSAPFGPGESLAVGEAARLLDFLAQRAGERRGGEGARGRGGEQHPTTQLPNHPITRGMAAQMLARFLDLKAPAGAGHYADLTPGSPDWEAAEALYTTWIDSRLWGYEKAFAPDGRLLFRPDTPLTRAQFAQMLRFAHVHFGPLWEDYPMDRQPTIPVNPGAAR
jgi:hypothetical protein